MIRPPIVAGGVRREIYSRRPDWWARFTWPITAGILVWTAVGAETFLNRWTHEVPKTVDSKTTAPPHESSEPVKPERELRPWNHRALASFLLFISGTSLAVLFVHGRSSIIKKADGIFAPVSARASANSSSKQMELKYIVLRSFGAFGSQCSYVCKRQCDIIPTKNKNELKLRVNGESTYWLGLDNARINGEEVPGGPEAAYTKLVQMLELNPKVGQWKGGPIVSRPTSTKMKYK